MKSISVKVPKTEPKYFSSNKKSPLPKKVTGLELDLTDDEEMM